MNKQVFRSQTWTAPNKMFTFNMFLCLSIKIWLFQAIQRALFPKVRIPTKTFSFAWTGLYNETFIYCSETAYVFGRKWLVQRKLNCQCSKLKRTRLGIMKGFFLVRVLILLGKTPAILWVLLRDYFIESVYYAGSIH